MNGTGSNTRVLVYDNVYAAWVESGYGAAIHAAMSGDITSATHMEPDMIFQLVIDDAVVAMAHDGNVFYTHAI